MARVVVATQVDPYRRSTGGEVATSAFITALEAARHQVRALFFGRPGSAASAGGRVAVEERPIETAGAGGRALAWMILALLWRRAYSVQKFVSRTYRARLRQALAEGADLLIVDHAQMGWVLAFVPRSLPVIFVAHNVERELYAAIAARTSSRLKRWVYRRESERIGTLEDAIAQRAAQVWTLTAADADHFRRRGLDQVRCVDLPGMVLGPGITHAVVRVARMLGSWTWEANAAGLRWFVREVRPLLATDLRVEVGGRGAADVVGQESGVEAIGFVDDATAFLAQAAVIVIPTVEGAGIQVKTLDAIATGRPVVCTTVAVRGLGDLPSTVRVADDPRAFAGAVDAALRETIPGAGGAEAVQWARDRRDRFQADIAGAVAHLSAAA